MDYHEDIRAEKLIARGGGGTIHFGAIVNSNIRSKFAFCADSVAIKTLTVIPDVTLEDALEIFHQEVSVMKYFLFFSFFFLLLFFFFLLVNVVMLVVVGCPFLFFSFLFFSFLFFS
jgi:hypothetical protein